MTSLPILMLLPLLFGAVLALLAGLWRAVSAQIIAVASTAIALVMSVVGLITVTPP